MHMGVLLLTENGRLANRCPLDVVQVCAESLGVGVGQGADEHLLCPVAARGIRGNGLVKNAAHLAVPRTTWDETLGVILFDCVDETAQTLSLRIASLQLLPQDSEELASKSETSPNRLGDSPYLFVTPFRQRVGNVVRAANNLAQSLECASAFQGSQLLPSDPVQGSPYC